MFKRNVNHMSSQIYFHSPHQNYSWQSSTMASGGGNSDDDQLSKKNDGSAHPANGQKR